MQESRRILKQMVLIYSPQHDKFSWLLPAPTVDLGKAFGLVGVGFDLAAAAGIAFCAGFNIGLEGVNLRSVCRVAETD